MPLPARCEIQAPMPTIPEAPLKGVLPEEAAYPLAGVLLSGLDDSKYLCVWSNIDNIRPDVDDSEGAIDRTSLNPFRGDDKCSGWKCLQESGRVWSKTSGVSTLDDLQKRVSVTEDSRKPIGHSTIHFPENLGLGHR